MAKRPAPANYFRETGPHSSGDFMAKTRRSCPRLRAFEALKNTARFLPAPPHEQAHSATGKRLANAAPLVESGRSRRAAFHDSLPGN
jgi:hypothetical protein